jgi:hypothetical protein
MIHADRNVTMRGEPLLCDGGLLPARRSVRQRGVVNQAHMRFHPWHMGVAEQRDPRRFKRQGLVDGGQNVFNRLTGQAVHQVDIDVGDALMLRSVGDPRDGFEGLYPVDGFLNGGVQILHAEA